MGKKPPINLVRIFLYKYGIKDGQPGIIHTDQGGELARSIDFRDFIADSHYILETTRSDAAFKD